MKVVILKTGKTEEVNDSYGGRLIEQGKAVLPEADKEAAKERRRSPRRSTNQNAARKVSKHVFT